MDQYNKRLDNYGNVERGQRKSSGKLEAPNQKDFQHIVSSPEFKLVDKPKNGK